MEPAKIDWKRIDSHFVEDVYYEHIRAPKWFDFLGPDDPSIDDNDEAWFCRPDCDHPKTAEDFFSTPPAAYKVPNGGDAGDILRPTHQKQSHKKLWRGTSTPPSASNTDDSRNQSPNMATPPSHQTKSWRAAALLKSSSVKKTNAWGKQDNEDAPRLKSTLSARNILSGRDILGHISEFCYELKRLATRVTEREESGESSRKEEQEGVVMNDIHGGAHLEEAKKQRMPLLEVDKAKLEGATDKGSDVKEKRRRKKRADDAENIPMALNMGNVKSKGEERLLQIRTDPPSPQCFSGNRPPTKTTAVSKPTRPWPLLRGSQEAMGEKERKKTRPATVEAKEEEENSGGRGLDVLWFLKPCTLAA